MPDVRITAVLGAGALGAAMAERLGETGHDVRLWNRTPERAHAAAAQANGVTAIDAVADAVSGAGAVLTVLRDGDAVAEVMADAIDAVDEEAVWIQASTVGPASASALAELARAHGLAYLDAPVSGSTTPAREGKLVWLVAGEDAALDRARRCWTPSAPRCACRNRRRGQRAEARGQRLDDRRDHRHERRARSV